jgi:hypothetical protein
MLVWTRGKVAGRVLSYSLAEQCSAGMTGQAS